MNPTEVILGLGVLFTLLGAAVGYGQLLGRVSGLDGRQEEHKADNEKDLEEIRQRIAAVEALGTSLQMVAHSIEGLTERLTLEMKHIAERSELQHQATNEKFTSLQEEVRRTRTRRDA